MRKNKLDKRDFQLLNIMAQNCRVPHTTIAQALHISKDTVAYKLRNLYAKHYLNQYALMIDARKLGFTRYHFLIKFNADIASKETIYVELAKHPFVMWINTFIGRYDIQIIVDAKDGFHLNKIREELFTMCNHQIRDYIVLSHLFDLEFTHLIPPIDLDTSFEKKFDHSFSALLTTGHFPVSPLFDAYSPNALEIELLQILAHNPQESLVTIAKRLDVDRQTVKIHIESLIKQGVITNIGAVSNSQQFGYVTYYMLVRLTQETPLSIMKKPFQKLKNIFYAGRMLGNYDMLLYLHAKNPQELNSSIELFQSEIGTYIHHYDLLVQDNVHHWRHYTPGIYASLKK